MGEKEKQKKVLSATHFPISKEKKIANVPPSAIQRVKLHQ